MFHHHHRRRSYHGGYAPASRENLKEWLKAGLTVLGTMTLLLTLAGITEVTLLNWLSPWQGHPTLVEVLAGEWRFVVHKVHELRVY
jgi:hypothetical protein